MMTSYENMQQLNMALCMFTLTQDKMVVKFRNLVAIQLVLSSFRVSLINYEL